MFSLKFNSKLDLNKDYLAVLNTLSVGVLIHNFNSILFINKVGSSLLRIQKKEEKDFYSLPYSQFILNKQDLFFHNGIENKQLNFKNFKNQLFKIEAKSSFLDLNESKVNQLIFTNLTENNEAQKNSETELIKQINKYEAILNNSLHIIWTVNCKFKLTSFNQNYSDSIFDIYGFYPELGKIIKRPKSSIYSKFWKEKYNYVLQGNHTEFILERKTKTGEKITTQIFLSPIKNSLNQVLEISGIGFDITENKKNEEKLTQSLREKEILLKELHHRVKNNMQVISSILNLQSSYVKDNYAYNLLKECQNRIKSMAFIHESLYQSKNLEFVNFSEYVSVLCKNLINSYTIHTRKIKLVLTLSDLMLSIDSSIPCGLIINEIISNSLKYAFLDDRDGIIFVTLETKDKKISLTVGDNGIGIPDNVNIKDTQTLGLQLVNTLVEQINGTIVMSRKNGTKFLIEFNM